MPRIPVRHPGKLLTALVLCSLLAACDTLSYYSQAMSGQLNLLRSRQDLQQLIDYDETPPELKAKLELVLSVREFAEQELSLPVKGNFGTYVDLERPFVVWNVFATPAFSMTPLIWCYPVAGCVSYRGYFDEQSARDYAAKLEEDSFDVFVGGVAAYSTLGWFADPLLNTVIGRQDYQLASLLFHELAHQQVYVKGDTDFNESFATAVEREGLRRWLSGKYSSEDSEQIQQQAQLDFDRQESFVALIQHTVNSLKLLYESGIEEDMQWKKVEQLEQLRENYIHLKAQWDGYAGYDDWFSAELNNAQLSTVATYYRWVNAFENLLDQSDSDLPVFYEAVRKLGRLDSTPRAEALQLLEQGLAADSL